jgi:hypothetical protein
VKTSLAHIIASSITEDGKPDRRRIFEALRVTPDDPVSLTIEAAITSHESMRELVAEFERQRARLGELHEIERQKTAIVAASFEGSLKRSVNELQIAVRKCTSVWSGACTSLVEQQQRFESVAGTYRSRAQAVALAAGGCVGALLGLTCGCLLGAWMTSTH